MAASIARASTMSVLQRFAVKFLGLFNTILLVRLLVPEDFGIVALAAIVQATLESITQAGMGIALIRMRTPTREQYDTAFTLTVLRGSLIAILLALTADLQASFMGDPRISSVMYVQATGVILSSFESIRMADLHMKLQYDTILKYNVSQKIVGLMISVPSAFYFRNYWALVISAPIALLIMIPVSYRIAPYLPKLNLKCWRDFFYFSKWLMVGNLVNVVESHVMTFVVGRLNGLPAVGLYQVAAQVALLPISEIAAPLRIPAYAAFALVQDNRQEIQRQFMTSLGLQAIVIVPLCVGIALTSEEATLLFLGIRWVELIPLMSVVALFGLFDAVAPFVFNVFIVLGRQRQMVLWWAATVMLRLIAVAAGASSLGVLGAAYGMLGSAVFCALLWSALVMRLLAGGLADIARVVWRPTIAALAMVAMIGLVSTYGPVTQQRLKTIVLILGIKAGLGAATYASVLIVLWFAAGRPYDAAEPRLLGLLGSAAGRLGLRWNRA